MCRSLVGVGAKRSIPPGRTDRVHGSRDPALGRARGAGDRDLRTRLGGEAGRGVLGLPFPWLISSERLHHGYALLMLVALWMLRLTTGPPAGRGGEGRGGSAVAVLQVGGDLDRRRHP